MVYAIAYDTNFSYCFALVSLNRIVLLQVVIDSDDFIATVLRRFRQIRRSEEPSPLRKNAIER